MSSTTPGGLIVPEGIEAPAGAPGRGTIVNETDLPDAAVQAAVETYFEENASMLGIGMGTTFQTYANQGSLLARSKYRTPGSVMEEVALARDLADRDDDVAETIGAMIALAFSEGMQNTHADEVTLELFNEVAKHMNLDHVLAELYRELLIASSVTTVQLYTQESFQFTPGGSDRQRTRQLVAPLVGVIPAEQIRVIGNDMLGTGILALRPATARQETFLDEFFADSTTAARKAELRRIDPVLTKLVTGVIPEPDDQSMMVTEADGYTGLKLYRLNPLMVQRSTFPKGAARYPRPLMTRNFALVEAKRLLNIMDYALLQGGSNFLVVAKKGTDAKPAKQPEIDNLHEVLRRATRTGVIIGDHRLNIEIITPDLKELLNPAKRRLLGRKIATALLRLPEVAEADAGGGQAVIADVELLSRVIANDRNICRRHIETHIYGETARRNQQSFSRGAAGIWFPRIVLQGTQFFTDMVLKLNDRGALSRRTAVEAGGFSYEHEVAQRKREKKHGDDRAMVPPQVPFSSPALGNPNAGPNDNGGGRPRGGSSNNGSGNAPSRSTKDPARPTTVIRRTPGETVRAWWEEELGSVRMGETTYQLLESYLDTKTEGRLTSVERAAVARLESEWPDEVAFTEGPQTIVGVNPQYDLREHRAVRLATGLSLIVGKRIDDNAIVARALCFRTPEYTALDAQEWAFRWGFLAFDDELADDDEPAES